MGCACNNTPFKEDATTVLCFVKYSSMTKMFNLDHHYVGYNTSTMSTKLLELRLLSAALQIQLPQSRLT